MKGLRWIAIIMMIMAVGAMILIALKISRLLDWPWIWILAPAWIPAAAVLIILPIPALIAAIGSRLEQRKRRKWY